MKKVLAIAAVTIGLGVTSLPANAQGYGSMAATHRRRRCSSWCRMALSRVSGSSMGMASRQLTAGPKCSDQLLATAVASAGTSSTYCCASRLRPIAQQSHRYLQRGRIARKAALRTKIFASSA
jgi:hypothetical protein